MKTFLLPIALLSLCAQAFAANLSLSGVATQGSTRIGSGGNEARFAIDGNRNGNFGAGSVTHTNNVANDWFQVNVGAGTDIYLDSVNLWNRSDNCCRNRLDNFDLKVLNAGGATVYSQSFARGDWTLFQNMESIPLPEGLRGEVVRIERTGLNSRNDNVISLAEVEVFGSTYGGINAARGGTARQSSTRGGSPSTANGGNDAEVAIDGIANPFFFDQDSVTHTGSPGPDQWWEVELATPGGIREVSIVNRLDNTQNRLQDVRFDIFNNGSIVYSADADIDGAQYFDQIFPYVSGDTLRITTLNNQHLHMAEVFVYIPEPSRALLLLGGMVGMLVFRRR